MTPTDATRFARIALGHVMREYPHKPGHVMAGPEDARTPASMHPVFHGSFDWHSCVNSYWVLARVLRRFPSAPVADEIVAVFDRQLVAEKVAGECAFFAQPSARGFERPYGWGWLLKLAAEMSALPDGRWSQALAPLAAVIVRRFENFLPVATYAVRAGTHGNTAFALRLAADYPDRALGEALRAAAARWYGADLACPAWGEPSGDDFLSPALIEAECMRVLHPGSFAAWFAGFLPALAAGEPATLFRPAVASDRSDGKIAHLDGLNLSRAWCLRALAPWVPSLGAVVEAHVAASLPHLETHYMGAHWLAAYATLALDEGEE